jgi:hypothetical protein
MVIACCLVRTEAVAAQDAAPFVFAKQFSADVVTTDKKGDALESKMYVDSGMLRTEANTNGTSKQILIIRPDRHKFYQVMVDRKMVMETPMDSVRYKKAIGPFAPKIKFQWIGSETVDGVACTKYKGTYPGIYGHAKVVFLWVDAAKQVPTKLWEENGTTILKNFKAAPQDAALFVFDPPADFTVNRMPAAIPGGLQEGGGQY